MNKPPATGASKWTIGITIVILAITIGWWAPNIQEWHACGTPVVSSVFRGLFSKPTTSECAAADQDPADPASDLQVTPPPTPPAPDCIQVTPQDGSSPYWIHGNDDGTPC